MTETDVLQGDIRRLEDAVDRIEENVSEVVETVQRQGTILQRVQFEVDTSVKQFLHMAESLAADVKTHLMEPTGTTGTVTRVKDIENRLRAIHTRLEDAIQKTWTMDALDKRVKTIEDAREDEEEDRRDRKPRWVRDLAIPIAVALGASLIFWAISQRAG